MMRQGAMSRLRSMRNLPLLLLALTLLSTGAVAQKGDVNDPRALEDFPINYRTAPGTCVIIFTVRGERGGTHLDRQAVLKLVNATTGSAVWQTTNDRAQAVFTDVAYGKYEVEAGAVGYLTSHKDVDARDSMMPTEVSIALQRDPSAINLDVAANIMAPKARKQAKRAIALLKSGNLAGAQKQLTAAYQSAPSSPELSFLLGYLYFQKRDLAQAGSYLITASTLNPRNGQALTLLGRTEIEREDYPAARSALEQAVLVDAENWIPHSLLADTYLHQRNYGRARDEARIAIEKSRGNAGAARLVLGEALVGLGHNQEGTQALNTFLDQYPQDPVADQVRNFISRIPSSPIAGTAEYSSIAQSQPFAIDTLASLPAPALSETPWQPRGVDEFMPAIVPGAVCPSAKVIEESGKRVEELLDDVSRFAAVEDLFHQSLDPYGIPIRTETRKYNYVAAISEPEPGYLDVNEFRTDKIANQEYPDHISSTGFAALALVFHPRMRDAFVMSCEGLSDWKAEATWLVRFRQRDDRANRMHSYRIGSQTHPVGLKGRAWITADKFQIVRIEAEMIRPLPDIQLLSEHQIVEYGPISFPKKNTTLWLPKSAEIYLDFRKHHYYRRHSFDHYMLFAVDTQEKTKMPSSKSGDVDHSNSALPASM